MGTNRESFLSQEGLVALFRIRNYERPPAFLANIHALWMNLCEISADRMGMIAVNNFESAISAMFKLSSGLDMTRYQVSVANFIKNNDNIVEKMTSRRTNLSETHPANPIRIKAIEIFQNSRLYASLLDNGQYMEDAELDEKIDALIDLLAKRPENESEQANLDFLAAAGSYLIGIDEDVAVEEKDALMNILSLYHCRPPSYVEKLLNDNDLMEIIDQTTAWITANRPQDIAMLFEKLILLITKDRRINNQEIDAIMLISEKLKIPVSEAVEKLLNGIASHYLPLS